MRLLWAVVCLPLAVLAAFVWHQGALNSQVANAAAVPQSSLELGPAFDRDTQWQFEQQIAPVDLRRLVRLNSRLALADATCPVPADQPRRPFYLKLNADLTREFAATLQAAGVTFVGYCWPHTHIVRASDAAALDTIRAIVLGHPMVEGTLLQQDVDRMDLSMLEVSGDFAGDYSVLFWRDVSAAQAVTILEQAQAVTLEGKVPRVSVSVPHTGAQLLLNSVWVEQITPRRAKVITNATSTAMSNANQATVGISPYLLDGNGQVAGVWDAGVARESHEQYTGLGSVTAPTGWAGSSRIDNVNSTTMHYHAAHVTGTIVGNGTNNATAHGYAPKALCLVHLWNNIDSGRRDARHFFTHVADNHSWASFGGGGSDWGGYNIETQEPDITNRDMLLCQVQSAGNYATNPPVGGKPFGNGNPTCSVPTANAHRNGFIIAAAEDNENLAGFSSCGPALDGRLVPQFCANGVSLVSSGETADNNYNTLSGTSMSGPSACGSVVLLSQLWRREHADQLFTPDIARAVLAQTCRDKDHVGPDYHYGFGIVDCKAAADLILADKAAGGARIFRGTVASGEVKEYSFNVSGGSPLHIVLNWLDIWASTTASVALVNDLDIELESPTAAVFYPYRGVTTLTSSSHDYTFTNTGANNRDNIELVHVDSPAAGTWTLRVIGTSIPANPQTGVPNDQTGFVVASSHNVSLQKLFFDDAVNGGTPVSIPDNSAAGITRSFVVNDARVVVGVRVLTRVSHERRGDIAIRLTAPGGPTVNLKTVNNGMFDDEYDVIAVFPDTKQDDDDMTALHLKPVQGTWTINVSDNAAGNTGSLRYLALELDVRVNNAPNADAGTNVTVRETNGSQLDGSASNDPDGDPFTYLWAQTGGVTVNLSSTTVAQPTFTAPAVSADQNVTFQLTVTDMSGASDTDTVQITIQNNLPPVADAGTDVTVRELLTGQLNATGTTDPESDPVTYLWTQLSGITTALSSATAGQPTFAVPAVTQDEVLVYQLTATDNRGDSDTDTVQVTISNNLAPQADAGANVALITGNSGALDGTASTDPESDPLSYAWLQVSGTATVVLSNPAIAQPTFTAPAITVSEVVTFQLTVTDNRGDFGTDTVAISIELNVAPVADAGNNFALMFNAAGQLDGSASFDPNTGDTLTYLWVQTGGAATVALSDATDPAPTFTAPPAKAKLIFLLTVTDARGLSDTDAVAVWVNATGIPPVSTGGGGDGGDDGGCSSDEADNWWWVALVATLLCLQFAKISQRLAHRFAAFVGKRRQGQPHLRPAQSQQ